MIELARMLYGSQNYGLDGPNSDRDYKALLCPEFEELYEGKTCRRGEGEHVTGMDLRRFHALLIAGNPNAVELLYSAERDIGDERLGLYLECARMMYGGGYVAAVWRTFYAALTGLALNGMDREGTTPKMVARAYYFLHLAKWVAANGFVIDEGVYRGEGPEFHRLARNIRFGKNEPWRKGLLLQGIAQDVMRGFAQEKAELQRKADAACKGTDWTKVVKGMDELARTIVLKAVAK